MGRKNKEQSNRLEIQPVGDGLFRLSGYINGERVRKQSRNLTELEGLKTALEHGALQARIAQNDRHILPPSWLTPAQLRDAESAFQILNGSNLTLAQCAQAGLSTLGDGAPVKTVDALRDYYAWHLERQTSHRTQTGIKCILSAMVKFSDGKETLGEFDSRTLERFILRPGFRASSQVEHAVQVRAFFKFCLSRKFLKTSPFQMDLTDLKKRAFRTAARPLILTPEQSAALLKAAMETDGGNHVPFVILSLWCSIRRQEVQRLTIDDIRFGPKETIVTITPQMAKTASYRRVTVPANVAGLLKECADRGLIDKSPIGPPVNSGWIKIREKAGLISTKPSKKFPGNRIITNVNWQEHILRHTGVSYLFQSTGDIGETARQAGHSTDMAFKHYVHLPQDGDAARFYAVTASFKDQPQAKPVEFQASA